MTITTSQAHRCARVARDHRLRRLLERRRVHGPEHAGRASAAAPSADASSGTAPSAAAVTGTINVSGSSTVEPISTAVAELVKASNAGFNFTVTGPGTGDGFKTFCKGETDISDASRKIKDEEAATCKAAGIEYIELKIAYDGMTVMTSPDNAAVDLPLVRRPVRADRPAVAGLREVVVGDQRSPRSSARTRSSRTRTCRSPAPARSPARTTASSSWSSPPIAAKQTPPAESATRPDYVASANDNAIIAGVEGSPSSLGWVGFAYAQENKDKIKELGVAKDPNGTCVQPTDATIADGTLPALAEPLHLRQQGQGRRQPGRRGLRRLLPRRRHDLEGPRDGPVREPAGDRARRHPDRLGSQQVAFSSSNRPGQLGMVRPVPPSARPYT